VKYTVNENSQIKEKFTITKMNSIEMIAPVSHNVGTNVEFVMGTQVAVEKNIFKREGQ
jgi:hypothetical protein